MASEDFDSNVGKAIIGAAPAAAPGSVTSMLHWIIRAGVDGAGPLPAARVTAGKTLSRAGGDVEEAIGALVRQHISLAGAQGFATNVGGIVVSLVSMPANIAGIAVIQARMVASIAHLRGYDVDDARVRQAILMTLLGKKIVNDLIADKEFPGSPLVVATAPALDREVERIIAERVTSALLTQSGGKQLVSAVGRKIPIIGGGVGLATDGYNTMAVARYAREQFVNRRPAINRPADSDQ